jgi:pimeloyl-ACP methyl ester carboxylesterase
VRGPRTLIFRSAVSGATVAVAALATLATVTLSAQSQSGRGTAPSGDAAPPLQHLTVQSDGHPLAIWARIPPSPRAAMLLLHGRTWSSRPDFDLQVSGLQRSVLQSLAARGIAAYALDGRGYGATPRDSTNWLTPKRAAADASNVLRWIATRHPTLPPPALLGWSLGAAVAHLAAATTPSLLSSLVLFGYAPDPDGIIPSDGPDVGSPLREKTTADGAASDFISPKVTPPAVVKAFVEQALKADPMVVDWKSEDQFVYDSARISAPTLVMFGDRDPGVDLTTAERFFTRLKNKDKQLVTFAGADHCAHLEDTHDAWITTVATFVLKTRP